MARIRIVLDTDVVSLYRTGRLPAGFAHHVATNDLSIAFATAGELWKWAMARRWGGARRGGLELFLDQALILPAGLKVAKVWGEMAAAAQRRGRPRPFNDSWIAACCIEGGLPLLTLNRRDFADFAEHDGLVLLGVWQDGSRPGRSGPVPRPERCRAGGPVGRMPSVSGWLVPPLMVEVLALTARVTQRLPAALVGLQANGPRRSWVGPAGVT